MTISTTSSSITVSGTGLLTSFQFPFVGVSASDLSVIYTDARGNQTTLTPSQYIIALNAPGTNELWGVGGIVTYPITGSPIAQGTTLTIVRTLPFTQETTVRNQGNYYAQVTETALDIEEMQIQQVEAQVQRSIQIPVVDTGINTILPAAAARANLYLAFDSNGQPVVKQGTQNTTVPQINYGFNNFIVSPTSAPPPPASGLAISLPSGSAILNGFSTAFAAINATLADNSIYDYWLNSSGQIVTYIGTPTNYTTALPNLVPNLVHLWRVYTSGGNVISILQMANTYPSVARPLDQSATIDNFVENFYLYNVTTNWSSGAAATYGELILTTDGNVYQIAAPCPPGTVLGTSKPTGQAAGVIVNGTANLFYYCQKEYLGNFRYAPNNGCNTYFTQLGLRRVAHRTLLTGSPLGPGAGTAMTTLIKNYLINQFQQLILNRVNSGTYIKNMKMIAGGYIWLCTVAGTAAGSSPFSGSYTPGSSTVTDGGITWLCIYTAYSTQQYFWMDVDRTFLNYTPPDSDDSYWATFVSLIARYVQLVPGDAGFIFGVSTQPSGSGTYYSYKQIFDAAQAANLTNQVANNLTYTFQNQISPVDGSTYSIQFLEDNCESYSGFFDAAYLYGVWGDAANQSTANTNATTIANGIALLFDVNYNVFTTYYGLAVSTWIGIPNKPLYPYLQAQLFPELHNIPTVNQDTRNLVRTFVSAQFYDWWMDKGKDTFPQNVFGFLACRMWQDATKAYFFQENTDRYFLVGGALIISEFCYYLDIKDNLVNPFTLIQQTGTQVTIENQAQVITSLQTMGALIYPNAAGAFSVSLPANSYITDIILLNSSFSTGISGGLNIGTTSSASNVVAAVSVGTNSFQVIPQANLLQRAFSTSLPQTLFFSAAITWGVANLSTELRYSILGI